MSSIVRTGALAAALFFGASLVAEAHVAFEVPQASASSTYKATLGVPHGCEGQPTLKLRVRIPEGVTSVKPVPKAGWTLETVKRPSSADGKASEIDEIVWSGSLADEHYDEFVFRVRLTDALKPGSTVYFPVVQECSNGSERWIEVPRAGENAHALKSPAPGVRIAAADLEPAHVAKAGPIVVDQLWSRATPGGAKVAGGYMRITNTGNTPDRLIGGSFAAAGRFEVHEMSMSGSVMQMRPIEGGLEIKPGASVELKPGGMHAMFLELREPLRAGQSVKGTLVFEKAGTVEVEYAVQPIGSTGPAAEHKH
jgi:uncharacterized protein YcnI